MASNTSGSGRRHSRSGEYVAIFAYLNVQYGLGQIVEDGPFIASWINSPRVSV